MYLIGVLFAIGTLLFIRRFGMWGRSCSPKCNRWIKTLVVMGSGGHTTEMIELLKSFDISIYKSFVYVLAETDKLSNSKISEFHSSQKNSGYKIETIPRSREVGQSWFSSIGTTLYATLYSVPIVWRHKPDLILVNGPGTCIPIVFAAVLFNICRITDAYVVYEESTCCVENLSLSGKILYYTRSADEIIVQWPQLTKKYPQCRYIEDL